MKGIFSAVALGVAGLLTMAPSQAEAGASHGPQSHTTVIAPRGVDVYRVTFVGGEVAAVYVNGDGSSDLDLYVYDEYGHLVACDEDADDECLAVWVPPSTGRYVIRIVNRGYSYNRYTIRTN